MVAWPIILHLELLMTLKTVSDLYIEKVLYTPLYVSSKNC